MLYTTWILVLFFTWTEASRASTSLNLKRQTTKFTDLATWFNPSIEGGPVGACGPEEKDDSIIVALNPEQYGDLNNRSSFCGRSVRMTYGNKTVDAVINDACPECSYGDLDLTQNVFLKLDSLDAGSIGISWEFI